MKESGFLSIAIVIPYFGKFPNYFPLWLESCRSNPSVDWFVFTDDKSKFDYPSNVHIFYMEFQDVVNLVQKQFDFKVEISSPYKLCDFKPTYGVVFLEYLKDFDFWGFGDLDLIYGDIRHFLNNEILINFDKILIHGPFCLMKNEERNNNVFRNQINGRLKHKEVFTDVKHTGFDEYGDEAFNSICELSKLKIYKNNLIFADINSWKKHFSLTYVKRVCSTNELASLLQEDDETNHSSVFLFDKGKLTRKFLINKKVVNQDYMYVHFQKRKMKVCIDETPDKFLMIPNKFISFIDNIDSLFLRKFGRKKIFSQRRLIRQIRVYVRMFIKNNLGF